MQTKNKIFIVLSLVLACSDILFVWINYRSSQKALMESLEQAGDQIQAAFFSSLEATETRMLQIATFVGNDERVQQLFLKGKRAVESEGGGPGGVRAAVVRKELYDLVGPSRDKLAEQFHFRQLHFHLGPGSVSFLRAHKPGKFGDRMDDVRYTIVAANQEHVPTRGFETGRVVSGIRGVIPVTAIDTDGNTPIHVGALEAGTSFQTMLTFLQRHQKINIAVLLTVDHLQKNIWPDRLAKFLKKNFPVDGFTVESTTSDDITTIMEMGLLPALWEKPTTVLRSMGQKDYAITAFGLRDFQGTRDKKRSDVGLVVAWRDVSHETALFHHSMMVNIAFAIIGFLIFEVILFFGIRASSRKLEQTIKDQQAHLKQKNRSLKEHIVQRKKAEKEKEMMQVSMFQARKMESVGQLAAGIAHEINTPLQYVGSNMDFLDEAFQDSKALITSYDSLLAAVKKQEIDEQIVSEVERIREEIDWDDLASEVPLAISQSREGTKRAGSRFQAMKYFAVSTTLEDALS
ncbi:MAG: hypothetical protein J7L69_12155, partial [Desulfobulbaceae bacterium]|nr:hypothetical protein [Desulfobulbaceae bacterium]